MRRPARAGEAHEGAPAPRCIDVATALDALAACVRDPNPRPGQGVLEAALARLGLSERDLASAPIVTEHRGGPSVPAHSITIGAVIALRAAGRADRRGASWPDAARAARRDVLRLLSVVPQAVIDTAHRDREGAGRDQYLGTGT